MVNSILLLLLGAELHDVEHRKRVLIEDVHATAAAIQLFDHEAEGNLVGRNSTIFLGDAHEAEAGIAIRLGDFLGHAVGLVHLLDDVLGEIAIAEFTHAFKQEFLFVGKSEIHYVLLNDGYAAEAFASLR